MDTQALTRRAATLTTREDAEAVAALISDMEAAARQIREARATLKDRLRDWIDENGPITVGEARWYVGTTTRHKLTNPEAALLDLLDATDGDLTAIAGALAANGIKIGALRELAGTEAVERAFTSEVITEAKTGAPKREVKSIPVAYSR